jgi:hypothetical protein
MAPERASGILGRPALVAGLGAVAAVVVAIRSVGSGFSAHDVRWHLVRIAQWHRGVLDGVIYPRFLHDVYWGHGGPVMLFYPPGPYVLSEAFCLAGAGPMRALELGMVTAFVVGAVGIFLLARSVLGPTAAGVASAAYTLAPYHLLNAWVRAAYAEQLAMAVLPFLLLAARTCVARPVARTAVWLAFASALVVLAHLISAVVFLPLAAAYGAWQVLSAPGPHRLKACACLGTGLAGGVLLSAFYWIPAVIERPSTYILETHAISYRPEPHLLSWRQLFETWWGFGVSGPGPDTMSFQIGWVHIAAIAAGVLLCLRAGSVVRREAGFWLAVIAVTVFLTTSTSWWVWQIVPLLSSLQYPWRLLSVVALGSSLCAGALVRLADHQEVWRAAIAAAVVAMTILVYFPFAATRPPVHSDEEFTPESISKAMSAERMWLPKGARPERTTGSRLRAVRGAAAWEVEVDRTHRLEALVHSDSGATLGARILYFPGWRAQVDGETVPLRADDTGTILVDVPAGDRRLRLTFGSTPLRTAAAYASAAGFAAAMGGLLWGGSRRR